MMSRACCVRVGLVSAVFGMVLSGAGCAARHCDARQSQTARPVAPAAINHIVFFKLRDPGDAGALIDDSRRMLGEIPGVLSLFAGPHIETGRASVETDYDACLYVGFATPEDYAAYVVHPNHTGLVGKWKDRFEWYRVFDVEDATFAGVGRRTEP